MKTMNRANNFYGDYTRLDSLGNGGEATVFKVRHNKLGYVRALRVLNGAKLQEGDKKYERFIEECKLLLRLGNGCHPNIVRVFHPLLIDGEALVEMDYIKGTDLSKNLKKELFIEIDEVLNLANDISSALAYCHEDIYEYCIDIADDEIELDENDATKMLINDRKRSELIKKYRVVHNDIHSGNIMRAKNGRYILLDFGLAIDGDDVVRKSRRENGVLEFKAPEKWDGKKPDTQSDIYSFGIVLYEMLAGRLPFVRDNNISFGAEAALYEAHRKLDPPPIFELRKESFERKYPERVYEKDYPDWLEQAILKCLEKEPKNRFANGKELFEFVRKNTKEQLLDNERRLREAMILIPKLNKRLEIAEQNKNELQKLLKNEVENNVQYRNKLKIEQEKNKQLKESLSNAVSGHSNEQSTPTKITNKKKYPNITRKNYKR